MAVDLFAGIPVSDYDAAVDWYSRLLGAQPSFIPNATEAVWELAEHRYVYVDAHAESAGPAMHTVFIDDLDGTVSSISARGIDPVDEETYSNGVRKVTYRDADGNQVSFGGGSG